MLSVSLEASFSSDGGFDFGATMTALGEDILGTDFGDITFDADDVLAEVGRLGPPELDSVLSLAADLAAGVDLGSVTALDIDTILAPLNDALSALTVLQSNPDLTVAGQGIGLAGLRAGLSSGVELFNGPLQPIVDLLGVGLPSLDLDGSVGQVTGGVGGLLALVTLLGGLMAVEAVAGKIDTGVGRIAAQLDPALAGADARRLIALSSGDLADRIASVDPSDGFAVDGLLGEIGDFVLATRAMQDSWAAGMGRGEAALLGVGIEGCSAQLRASVSVLDEALLPLVGALATSVRGLIDPVIAVSPPDPRASLDQAFDDMVELLVPLQRAIDRLDEFDLAGNITRAVGGALQPVSAVADTLDSVGTAVGAALREVGNVVDTIDLQPLVDGVAVALAPIIEVLDAIDAAVGAALDSIEAVAGHITSGLGTATAAIEDVAIVVEAAFGDLSDRLAAVDFEAVQAAIAGGLGQVTALLDSADLAPYFDAANDIIDTTTDVIDAVPFGLLPTDVQQEIVDVSRPVKQIDFDTIADGLRAELQSIMDSLNGDVLDEVDTAYQAVITFLQTIDPTAAIAEFEAGPFAELRAIVDGLDPQALLAPVEEALAPVRSTLDGLDLTAAVLDPVAGVFTVINQQLAELDPATLMAELVAEVDQVRTDVADTLRLSSWGDELVTGRNRIVETLERLDPTALAAAASGGAMDRLREQPREGPGLIGTVVGAIGQSSDLPADAASWPTVQGWLGPVDGEAEVRGRLAGSAELLAAVTADVTALDPEPAVVAASAHHRRLLQTLSGQAAGSRLRVDGELMLTTNQPNTTIAPLVENRLGYLARLRADGRLLSDLSVSGLSQINLTTDGLIDALLPVTSIGEWIRTMLGNFGLGDIDRPWPEILDELIATFGPDRLLGAMAEVIGSLRDKIVAIIDSAVAPITGAIDEVEGIVDLIDLQPIVDELGVVHADVVALVAAVDPAVLLGPVLADADAVVDRVSNFDPLGPIREVIDALQVTLTTVFDTVTPSVVFADIITTYDEIVALAAGLDVKGLLQPVLDALGNIEGQLEVGITETAVALGGLQDALPDEVEDAAASVSGSVGVGLSL